MTVSQANGVLRSVFSAIAAELKENGAIHLLGFGKIQQVDRKARRGRNPRTGKPIEIPARKALRWTASRPFLRDAGLLPPVARRAAKAKVVEELAPTPPTAQAPVTEGLPAPLFEKAGEQAAAVAQFPVIQEEMAPAPSLYEAPTMVGVGLPAAPATSPPVAESAAAGAGAPALSEDAQMRRAERTARVMIDDLFLYFGGQIQEAVKNGQNVEEVVGEQLAESRKTLAKRFGENISSKVDFVGQALQKKIDSIKGS